MTDDERAIRGLVDTWMAASQAGDLDTVLGLMTDDVIFMVPGSEPFGKEKFAAGARSMQDVRMEGKAEIQEIDIDGDRAWIRNYIRVTLTPPGRAPVRRAILRKEPDGKWRLHATPTW